MVADGSRLRSIQELMLMVGPFGEWVRYTVESPCVLAPECDGIRIISQTTHELLRRVPDPLADVFRPGSTAPGDQLLASTSYPL